MIGGMRPASALTPEPKLLAMAFFILSWLSLSTRAQGLRKFTGGVNRRSALSEFGINLSK